MCLISGFRVLHSQSSRRHSTIATAILAAALKHHRMPRAFEPNAVNTRKL